MKRGLWALATIVAFGATLAASQEAQAEIAFQYSVGAKGGMNLNLLSGPPEEPVDLPVSGFVGVSGGGGLAFEGLALNVVGLELDILYVKTEGTGKTEFTDLRTGASADIDQTLSTTELHFPILLKAQIPVGIAKPFIGLGITYVDQIDSSYEVDELWTVDTSGNPTESYSMYTLALGVAIDLPSVKVPIEVRGSYRPPSDKQEDRLQYESPNNTVSKVNVVPTWEGQVWVMIGVQYTGGI